MSSPNALQQIDQALMRLLQQRQALLQQGSFPGVAEQLAQARPLLAKAGISETAWQALVVHSLAALGQSPGPSSRPRPSRRITVVGGRGAMGTLFVHRFTALGQRVRILEQGDWGRAESLLGGADLVLVAAPLHAMTAVIDRVGPYLAPTTVLADVASTKTAVLAAMLAAHSGPVVGLHPMFGPGGASFLGHRFVVCAGRSQPDYQWLLDLLAQDGAILVPCTAEEHDAMMVAVQAIRFFSNFSLGRFLAEAGIDVERSLDFASPLYRMEMGTVGRLVAQDAALYVDILLASPERQAAIGHLAATVARLANRVCQGDRDGLIAEFEATRPAFAAGAQRSLAESDYLLNHLTALLAAQAVDIASPQRTAA